MMTAPLALPMADSYLGDAGDFLLINRFARRTSWLHGFMTGYSSTYGTLILVLLLVAGWWLARRAGQLRTMAALAWAGLGTLVAVGVNQPIVTAAAEKRPYSSIPHTLLLVSRSADYGFPSDHAVMAGAVATGCVTSTAASASSPGSPRCCSRSPASMSARITRTTWPPGWCWAPRWSSLANSPPVPS